MLLRRQAAGQARSASTICSDDGSMVSLPGVARRRATSSCELAEAALDGRPMTRDELAAALAEHAYLEGDFVLRSGRRSRYYLDKYRFETRPDLLGPLGQALADAVAEAEPDAARLAGPELGAVALAAAASLASGLPFLIVRKEAKEYGTANRLEGAFEEGERVCLSEDVSPPAAPRWTPSRRCGKPVWRAETPSASSTARRAVPTHSRVAACDCGRSSSPESCSRLEKAPQSRMVERKSDAIVRVCTVQTSLVRGGEPVTKQEFVEQVAQKSGLNRRDAAKAVDAFLESVTETLKKRDSVTFTGFGKFTTSERAAREGVNPRNRARRSTSPPRPCRSSRRAASSSRR